MSGDRQRVVLVVDGALRGLDLASYVAERDALAVAIVSELQRLIPPGRKFLLVDEEFLPVGPRLDDRECVRLPRGWPTFDENGAAREFERVRRNGIGFVVFAWPALWWLRQHEALRRAVRAATTLLEVGDGYVVFEMNTATSVKREPDADRERAAQSQLRERVAALEKEREHWRARALHADRVQRIGQSARALAPSGTQWLMVSQGDDALLRLTVPEGWHFPQMPDGVSSGHPADSAEAIAQLEALRRRGAAYLLIPRWTAWWLVHYEDLRRHLEASGARVCDDEDCVVYDLRRGGGS